MRLNKWIYAFALCVMTIFSVNAVEITGTTSVNVTADTAAAAKSKAFNSARRDVIVRELKNYANPEQLSAAVQKSSNEELMNMISSSSVAGERVSDTTYTANISFVIDGDAARSFMEKYSVQNWLPSSNAVVQVENHVVFNITLLRPMTDWADLNAAVRNAGLDLATTKITGNNVSFVVVDKDASKLIRALRENGWGVQSVTGGYRIWR